MMENQFSSQLLDNAVDELAKLPGVGRKTALRLALHLLRQTPEAVDTFAQAVTHLRHDVKYCQVCHNISDTEVCPICADTRRDPHTICVLKTFAT